jgi:protein-S-isoprenylcysteine O-methyltransferase Ste14
MSKPDFALAVALWGAWLVFWIASARAAKPVQRRESLLSRALQTLPITVGGLLVLTPDRGRSLVDAHFAAVSAPFAVAIIVVGLAFTVWARRCLGDNWSADVAIRERHELVRSGPYRLVRHPIYTGGVIAVAGTVLLGCQWRGLVGFALVLATLIYKLRLEEVWLERLFGEAYARYQHEVPALVPLRRPSMRSEE